MARRPRDATLLALLLALAICAPLLRPGLVLTYDMVWVPHLDLGRPDLWGLGSALPRAVPSDAVVALLGAVVPSSLLQKLVLVGSLTALGSGVGRLMADAPRAARLAAVVLAVWNPFVAERLGLGQWPVLVACAGLPWLLHGLRARSASVTVLALAALAMSPATGLMGLVVVLVAGRRRVRLALLWLAVDAPWIVTGLLHARSATSDPAAAGLFDVQPEGHLGRVGAVLSLGGVWNRDVVPDSRGLWTTAALVVVVLAVQALGARRLVVVDRSAALHTGLLAVVGVVVALAGWVVPGVVAAVADHVPGGGVVRDGTRWLLLAVPFAALTFGRGVEVLVSRGRTLPAVAVLIALVPVAALPDLAWGLGGRLHAVSPPAGWQEARDTIAADPVAGDVVVVPFTAYRAPDWNHGRPVYAPAGRWFDRPTVVDDRLAVSGTTIAGEDPRAADVRTALASSDPDAALARLGFRFVVDDRSGRPVVRALDDPAAPPRASARDVVLTTSAWIVAGTALVVGTGLRRRADRS